MFDSVIFSTWPRGLYLAKKLSETKQKVAYVEILPRIKNPIGLFLDKNHKEEKDFLEALGFLSRQEGGFWLSSSEGFWPFQDMKAMQNRHPVLKNILNQEAFKNFKKNWLAYLSFHLAGKVFEYNNSKFSDRGLNLFSDYFLFEPFFKKIDQFHRDHSQIDFYKVFLKDIFFDDKNLDFFIRKQLLKSKRCFWFSHLACPALKKSSDPKPYWEWSSLSFEVDFGTYDEVIPSHFVSIQHLFLPWVHDNFLSVFYNRGQSEVWVRQTYGKKQVFFIKDIQSHLSDIFPGVVFSHVKKESNRSFPVYGRESLHSPGGFLFDDQLYVDGVKECLQGDLVSGISAERELFTTLQSF